MSTQWSYKKCLFCNGKIPYMPHWKNLPDKCNDCIFSEILNLPALFKKFLEKESSHNQRYMSAEDLFSYKSFYEYSLVLAEVSWGCNSGVNDSEPTITFIGKEHPSASHVNWGDSYNQGGKCTCCNAIISCGAKTAVCPVCDSTVSCT